MNSQYRDFSDNPDAVEDFDQWQRIVDAIRLHGLGAPAIETVGIDLEGNPLGLADYRGKTVLLALWATWCPPCMQAIPHEKELVARFDAESFAILGVNGDSDPAVALAAVEKHAIPWRSLQDKREGDAISMDWHVGGWPTYYLIDAEGIIQHNWLGLPPQEELELAIEATLR